MKRPFMLLVPPLLGALAVLQFGVWTLPLCIAAFLVVSGFIEGSGGISKFLTISFFFLLFLIVLTTKINNFETLTSKIAEEKYHEGHGVVSKCHSQGDRVLYLIKPWWDDEGHKHVYGLYVRGDNNAHVGDKVYFEGSVMESWGYYNDGAFDIETYHRSMLICGTLNGRLYVSERAGSKWVLPWLAVVREAHIERLTELIHGEEGLIAVALLTGENSLSHEEREHFRKAGIAHLLALSGFHVAMTAGGISFLMKYAVSHTRIRAVVIIAALIIYCLYTGASPSTVRATWMMCLYFGRITVLRRYDKHVALAFALVIMLIVNPYQILGRGFQFSFLAVIAIYYVVPWLRKGMLKGDHWLVQSLRIILSVQLVLLPIILETYGAIGIYSLVGNLLVVPVVALSMSLSGVGLLLSYISWPVARFIAFGAFLLNRYMLNVGMVLGSLPLADIVMGQFTWPLVLTYYLTLSLWVADKKVLRSYALACLVVLIVITNISGYRQLKISMLDVGNGDAIFIQHRGRTMLIDGGGVPSMAGDNIGKRVLLPFMVSNGIRRIDLVMASHGDFDHVYGIIELMDQVPLGCIVVTDVYETEGNGTMDVLISKAEGHGVPVIYCSKGSRVTMGHVTMEILYPPEDFETDDTNRQSLIALLRKGDFSMLFTGDGVKEDERALVELYGDSISGLDVLKVGHHGSSTSTDLDFLKHISPKISLVSAGRNNPYGHPTPEVMTILNSHSDRVFVTAESGQITLTVHDNRIITDTYIEE